MTEQPSRAEDSPEPPLVSTRLVILVALSILSFVAASIAGGRVYYVWQVRGPVNGSASKFPSPALQIDDAADLANFEEDQKTEMQKYEWVDRSSGLIVIPVDRAMELVLARGSHAYDAIGSATAEPPASVPKR